MAKLQRLLFKKSWRPSCCRQPLPVLRFCVRHAHLILIYISKSVINWQSLACFTCVKMASVSLLVWHSTSGFEVYSSPSYQISSKSVDKWPMVFFCCCYRWRWRPPSCFGAVVVLGFLDRACQSVRIGWNMTEFWRFVCLLKMASVTTLPLATTRHTSGFGVLGLSIVIQLPPYQISLNGRVYGVLLE